jgi:hypothetical protein
MWKREGFGLPFFYVDSYKLSLQYRKDDEKVDFFTHPTRARQDALWPKLTRPTPADVSTRRPTDCYAIETRDALCPKRRPQQVK